jgi:hypothetical protein
MSEPVMPSANDSDDVIIEKLLAVEEYHAAKAVEIKAIRLAVEKTRDFKAGLPARRRTGAIPPPVRDRDSEQESMIALLPMLGPEYGAITETVTKLLRRFSGAYGLDAVAALAAHEGIEVTRDQIINVVVRLRKSNKIEVVQKGIGRRPALYKNVNL